VQRSPDGRWHALAAADRPVPASVGDDGSVQLYAPRGIAVRRDGSLVVADAHALQVFALAPPGAKAPAHALPAALPQATAGPRYPAMPWPVAPQLEPHEVVGVMGEVRGSYDGESRDHFHGGLDIRADVGARVLAILPATVSDPYPNWAFGDLGEGMSVGPLSYIHMRVGRDSTGKALDPRFRLLPDGRGKPFRVRVRRGTRFAVGDALGTVNPMAHVHMEYRPAGALVNPLTLPFVGLRDTVAPHIRSIALVGTDGKRLPAKKGRRVHVARSLGQVDIVADGFDQMDGNLARRRLGLYKIGYQLLHADGTPVPGFETPRITQTYDRLPRARRRETGVCGQQRHHGLRQRDDALRLCRQQYPGGWDGAARQLPGGRPGARRLHLAHLCRGLRGPGGAGGPRPRDYGRVGRAPRALGAMLGFFLHRIP
jgi:hypothetical protein